MTKPYDLISGMLSQPLEVQQHSAGTGGQIFEINANEYQTVPTKHFKSPQPVDPAIIQRSPAKMEESDGNTA